MQDEFDCRVSSPKDSIFDELHPDLSDITSDYGQSLTHPFPAGTYEKGAPCQGCSTLETTTGLGGNFTLVGLMPGGQTFYFTKAGYSSAQTIVMVASGQVTAPPTTMVLTPLVEAANPFLSEVLIVVLPTAAILLGVVMVVWKRWLPEGRNTAVHRAVLLPPEQVAVLVAEQLTGFHIPAGSADILRNLSSYPNRNC